jgi:hypothetical protein
MYEEWRKTVPEGFGDEISPESTSEQEAKVKSEGKKREEVKVLKESRSQRTFRSLRLRFFGENGGGKVSVAVVVVTGNPLGSDEASNDLQTKSGKK